MSWLVGLLALGWQRGQRCQTPIGGCGGDGAGSAQARAVGRALRKEGPSSFLTGRAEGIDGVRLTWEHCGSSSLPFRVPVCARPSPQDYLLWASREHRHASSLQALPGVLQQDRPRLLAVTSCSVHTHARVLSACI